jgi:hypothetical protein
VLQQDKFPFRTTQQKVVPYRVLRGLSVELSFFSHRATSKKLLLYYTVLWFTDRVVVQRHFSLVEWSGTGDYFLFAVTRIYGTVFSRIIRLNRLLRTVHYVLHTTYSTLRTTYSKFYERVSSDEHVPLT